MQDKKNKLRIVFNTDIGKNFLNFLQSSKYMFFGHFLTSDAFHDSAVQTTANTKIRIRDTGMCVGYWYLLVSKFIFLWFFQNLIICYFYV